MAAGVCLGGTKPTFVSLNEVFLFLLYVILVPDRKTTLFKAFVMFI